MPTQFTLIILDISDTRMLYHLVTLSSTLLHILNLCKISDINNITIQKDSRMSHWPLTGKGLAWGLRVTWRSPWYRESWRGCAHCPASPPQPDVWWMGLRYQRRGTCTCIRPVAMPYIQPAHKMEHRSQSIGSQGKRWDQQYYSKHHQHSTISETSIGILEWTKR